MPERMDWSLLERPRGQRAASDLTLPLAWFSPEFAGRNEQTLSVPELRSPLSVPNMSRVRYSAWFKPG